MIPRTGGNTSQARRSPATRANGRRATTSTTSCARSASPTCRRTSRAGTPTSRSAARSSAIGCGSSRTCARSETTPTAPASAWNANAGNPAVWDYKSDLTKSVRDANSKKTGADPPDRAAHAAQQAGHVLRLPEAVHRLVVFGGRRAVPAAWRRLDGLGSLGGFGSRRRNRPTCGTTARRSPRRTGRRR